MKKLSVKCAKKNFENLLTDYSIYCICTLFAKKLVKTLFVYYAYIVIALTPNDKSEPVIRPVVSPVKTNSSDFSLFSFSSNRCGALAKHIVVIKPFDVLNEILTFKVTEEGSPEKKHDYRI